MEPTTTTVVKAIPIPNSSSPPPTIIMMRRDRDASFSSYLKPHHLLHHNHQIDDLDDDDDDESTTELSIFDAHKYFNSEDNNNNNNEIPNKVTIISNNRVSPLSIIPTHDDTTIAPEKAANTVGTTATATRYSSASSSVDGGGYRARSLNGTATPSEASWNSQAAISLYLLCPSIQA
ncbi:protein PHYTOCHROME KINASE SUBSTRATE 4-like [Arachis hypogaea]|nr:protein PHYTOCHROME KINASE SUBSTRATE 4-like [Arachis hypogaea]